jgi:nucleotidyltransferase/DNA polymerase involved in DNA repair
LNDIWGVGPAKAEKLYDSGFTSVAKLRASKSGEEALTTMQKIGLRYFEDLRQKIPRAEAT